MTTRWIAGLLCVLYLSASTLFAAVHHHDSSALDGNQQCAACAWHYNNTVDNAEAPPLLIPPDAVEFVEIAPDLAPRSISLHVCPNRGPPSSSR